MKKLKFSKSEYFLLINTLGVIGSLITHFMPNNQIGGIKLSFVFLLYSGVASIWFSIFVYISSELKSKRCLTKKEKNYCYLVYFAISAVCFVLEGCPLLNIIPFAAVSVIWLIAKAICVYTDAADVNAGEPNCDNPYYYESDEKTLKDFGADGHWHNKRREKQLRSIYIETAKDYSGQKNKMDIELIVQDRVWLARTRLQRMAVIIVLVLLGIVFFLSAFPPQTFADANLKWFGRIFMVLHLYSVFRFIAVIHDPMTPNDGNLLKFVEKPKTSDDLSEKDTSRECTCKNEGDGTSKAD